MDVGWVDVRREADVVARRLMARRETVAVAGSSAGGVIAAALLAVPGASAYFRGGAVVYTTDAKVRLLAQPLGALTEPRAPPRDMPWCWHGPSATGWRPAGASARRAPPAPPETAMAIRRDTPAWPLPGRLPAHRPLAHRLTLNRLTWRAPKPWAPGAPGVKGTCSPFAQALSVSWP